MFVHLKFCNERTCFSWAQMEKWHHGLWSVFRLFCCTERRRRRKNRGSEGIEGERSDKERTETLWKESSSAGDERCIPTRRPAGWKQSRPSGVGVSAILSEGTADPKLGLTAALSCSLRRRLWTSCLTLIMSKNSRPNKFPNLQFSIKVPEIFRIKDHLWSALTLKLKFWFSLLIQDLINSSSESH